MRQTRANTVALISSVAVLVLSLPVDAVAVWPQPSNATFGTDARWIDVSSFTIELPESWQADLDMHAAVHRTMERIVAASIAPFTSDRGAAQAAKAKAAKPLSVLQIHVADNVQCKRFQAPFMKSPGLPFRPEEGRPSDECTMLTLRALSVLPLEEHDEEYTLYIGQDDGPALLRANNALGALRGLATFAQLVYTVHGTTFVDGVPTSIADEPAFGYRGIMIDSARNYLSPTTIKRQLDAMELLKLNQLHWHVTDTSSWPLGLTTKGMEVLAERGAYIDGGIYNRSIVEDIIHAAAQRGINVIMEIDMPGHQYMGVKDYPGELITCSTEDPPTSWQAVAAEPPGGHLDIRKPAAAQLMKDIFTELAQYLPGRYVSTGNDEVEAQCYGLQKGDKNGTDALLAPFLDDVHSHLVSLGKTPMVWEEAALNFPKTAAKLKNGTLVQAWTTSANVEALLRSHAGLQIVHVPSDYFYLDCGLGTFLGNWPGGKSWCAFVTWQKQYSFDPLNGTEAIQGGAQRIAGGESALWSEQVDGANVEQLLWPRAASGAEVFWTGANYTLDGTSAARNVSFALPRLHEMRARLRAMGIGASPLQPAWCANRPGRCDLTPP